MSQSLWQIGNLTPNAFCFCFCFSFVFCFVLFCFLLLLFCFLLFCFIFVFCFVVVFVFVFFFCIFFLLILCLFCFVFKFYFPLSKSVRFWVRHNLCPVWNMKLKGAQSYLFYFFFKLLEILLSQNSSYFSYKPRQILHLKKCSDWEILMKPCLVMVTMINHVN